MPTIQQSVAALKAHGVGPTIAESLRASVAETVKDVLKRVVDEIDAFADTANPDVLPQLEEHLESIATEVCRVLSGAGPGDFDFVRSYAKRRAQQRFPLEAVLRSYRCSHRILSSWIRDAALRVADPAAQVRRVVAAAADFSLEYTDAISTLATSEYVLHTRLLAEAEGDQRTELLNTLLSGVGESDGRAAQLLKRGGYLDPRQSFCVAVARSVDANETGVQRMAESIGQTLSGTAVRTLVGIKDGLVTIVMSGARRSAESTAPQPLLTDRVHPRLERVGPAALIGLSDDAASIAHLRRAHMEARRALDFATVANRVMPYSKIPFRALIIRHAGNQIQSALPAWLEAFQTADRKARGALSKTLHAYADADMNALQTAKGLSVHANTIYSRLQRITDLTGKNALGYHDLTELLLALECDAERQISE